MTRWKDLLKRFWIEQFFFDMHAQKTLKKQRKSFPSCLKKSEKIQNFCFSKTASIWLLILSNELLSIPRSPKHLLEAPIHPMNIPKNWENRFVTWNYIFQVSRPSRFEKKHAFFSRIQRTKLFSRLPCMTHHAQGRTYGTKWKDLSIRFLIKELLLKKLIFCILMLKKLAIR